MVQNSEIEELQEIYDEMDPEGKKKMVTTAKMLFNTQKTIKNNQSLAQHEPQPLTQTVTRATAAKIDWKFQARRFSGVLGYFMTGFLLLCSAIFFWIILINPSLLMLGDTPLTMLRIIITALCGMFIIGTGLVRFLLQKLKVRWMILAMGAGILCVDPAVLTDFIGFAILTLIISIQVVRWKQEKAAVAG